MTWSDFRRRLYYAREALRLARDTPLRVLLTRCGHAHCYLWVIYNSFWMWDYTHRPGADYHYWNETTGKGDLST